MPADTNWVANIYHGLDNPTLTPVDQPSLDYVAYLGRIIEPKGVHLAIAAVKRYNETTKKPLTLKIAGKHYAEESKDTYWRERVEPELGQHVEYVGFVDSPVAKRKFLANARALLVPSLFDEPFGMVTLESFACGTPVIALNSGALSEVIDDGVNGYVVEKSEDELTIARAFARRIGQLGAIDRLVCARAVREKFSVKTMSEQHIAAYQKLFIGSRQ